MQILCRGSETGVPEKRLDLDNIVSTLELVRGDTMAKAMGIGALSDSSSYPCIDANAIDVPRGDGASTAAREEAVLGAVLFPVFTQLLQKGVGQFDIAVLRSLSLLHANHHSSAINVGDSQRAGFGDTKSRRIERHDDRSVFNVDD